MANNNISARFKIAIDNDSICEFIHAIINGSNDEDKLELLQLCVDEFYNNNAAYIKIYRDVIDMRMHRYDNKIPVLLDDPNLPDIKNIDYDLFTKISLVLYKVAREVTPDLDFQMQQIHNSRYIQATDNEKEIMGSVFWSPFHQVAMNGDLKNVIYAINMGYDIDERCNDITILMACSTIDSIDLFMYLIYNGASLYMDESEDYTILHWLINTKSIRCIIFFIEYAIRHDIDLKLWKRLRSNGLGLLHVAAKTNNIEVASLLLYAGIEKDMKDEEGRLALDIAVELENYEVAAIIVKNTDKNIISNLKKKYNM